MSESSVAARPLVLKFGGELLEDRARLASVVAAVERIVRGPHPPQGGLLLVHGGGKEIDAALKTAGIEKRQVEGLRITDDATLSVVVSILAGAVNTRLVGALVGAGVSAVGLTGADGACGLSEAAPPHRTVDGQTVDLGRVGVPVAHSDTRLVEVLLSASFVPVVASIGVGADGALFNVNADTLAGHLAGRLRAERLVIAGTTAGVLDSSGRTEPVLEPSDIDRLVNDGTATAGMIAKLRACEHAIAAGVGDVVLVDGRDSAALQSAAAGHVPDHATRIVGSHSAVGGQVRQ